MIIARIIAARGWIGAATAIIMPPVQTAGIGSTTNGSLIFRLPFVLALTQ